MVWPANIGQAPLWCNTLNFCQRGKILLYSVYPVKLCAFLRSNTLQFIDVRTVKSSCSTRGGLGVPRYSVWRRKHHLDGESLWITTACQGLFHRAVQEWFLTCISAGQKTRVRTQVCARRQQSLLFHLHSTRRTQKVIANLVTAVIWVYTKEQRKCVCVLLLPLSYQPAL